MSNDVTVVGETKYFPIYFVGIVPEVIRVTRKEETGVV